MSKAHFISLAALCAVLAFSSLATDDADAANTAWTCYRVNELPDLGKASSWKPAMSVAAGLNGAAPHTASGTVVNTKWDKGDADIICVKQ